VIGNVRDLNLILAADVPKNRIAPLLKAGLDVRSV
jgi:hypothetical protein